MAAHPLIEARHITQRFRTEDGADLLVLDDVSLHLDAGELVALIGPSGSGKTTLLTLLAGLDEPTSGSIALRGETDAPRLGQVGYMPQRDLLLPWRRALDNAAVGLEMRGVARAEARERARGLFEKFGLSGFEHAYPAALSGGMRQRVAFARSVLAAPDLLLLDEPFGALDALTRAELQAWLADVWEALGETVLLVTHDLDEALVLADRIYILSARPGRILLERANTLPRPRILALLATPQAAVLRAELRETLAHVSPGERSHP